MRELLTLYTLASVLVTNDSGPAHFASPTPVHTIVLFGPEPPLLFGSRIMVDEMFDAVCKAVAA